MEKSIPYQVPRTITLQANLQHDQREPSQSADVTEKRRTTY